MIVPIILLLIAATAAIEYDYIIVGGGTSGLVVANRLSENPDISVLIIEAGPSVLHNINVTDVDRYSYAFDTEIEWAYETIPQEFGGRSQILRAARALGGTSTINGLAYVRSEDVQIDAWQEIGNEGWTWANLLPYYLKSENFTVPDSKQIEAGATYTPNYHNSNGPVQVSFKHMEKKANDLTSVLNRTFDSLGLPWNQDLNEGHLRGFTFHPYTIDADEYVRHDAARAYYWPYAARDNLHVKLNTFVNRIVWRGERDGDDISAAGVEVAGDDGVSRFNAKRDVILAAGSLRSPAILELSGVGNPSILEQYDIPVRINLPTVGENLQEQLNTSMIATTNTPMTGSRTVAFASVSDIFGDSASDIAALTRAHLPKYANITATASSGTMKADHLQQLFETQHDLIFKDNIPIAEYIFTAGEKDFQAGYWGLLPFARGNVHITSADPAVKPAINPNYGMIDWDVEIQIAMSRYIRSMYRTKPLSQFIRNETLPGLGVVPEDASDGVWTDWVKEQYTPNYHPIGTAAMLPRSMGGVVDNKLKVYGTTNLRVVDASIHPLQLCGHPMSNLYAIAERLSDLMKEEM
ncbi:hypothetical protein ASPWEDRAFT_33058 [Aspergillus wentii DTO 134E9]|uniref:glucose oxidase n=1 Tax=Aspergillus wentii DTO 134E9 TaxID=1073089 RepID=A0A1L9R4L1_ASPWE|nr:uncharacterized protein ASPWEDRAFT_33058 [Aspergillus wentii DTO 134E9]KAI9927105.1 hypothetical protein MW887_003488 [Aspergillus wentii]OJJ29827.1 hypothetical protein ASPWEDRAFT_33058 [Aspergillus wentii DTO 134E9]